MTDCTERHTPPPGDDVSGEEFLKRNWWSRLVLGRYDSKRYGREGMLKVTQP